VIRMMVADDQDLVRTGLRMILEGEPDLQVVAEARDGAEAVTLSASLDIDVVLMDIRMPVLDGIEATRAICALAAGPKVLVLTTFDLDEYVYGALRAGASGFLLKDAKAATLVEAVRTVHAGEALLAPTATRRLIARLVAQEPSTSPSALALDRLLTTREREILTLIARGRSNQEIAADLVISEGTVKTHVGRVFAKLALRDRAQAVVAAYESGLVSVPSARP